MRNKTKQRNIMRRNGIIINELNQFLGEYKLSLTVSVLNGFYSMHFNHNVNEKYRMIGSSFKFGTGNFTVRKFLSKIKDDHYVIFRQEILEAFNKYIIYKSIKHEIESAPIASVKKKFKI